LKAIPVMLTTQVTLLVTRPSRQAIVPIVQLGGIHALAYLESILFTTIWIIPMIHAWKSSLQVRSNACTSFGRCIARTMKYARPMGQR